ncbi:MAG: Uma2 family endonuclease [Thermoleophilaceae bacterium]
MRAAPTMTAEEFMELPLPEHGRPWSLVEGEVVMNHPTPLHGRVQTRLIVALADWIRAGSNRGEVFVPLDVRIDDRNVYAPDVLWYAHGRAPGTDAKPIVRMPDLAVEVRSPSTWRYDIGVKKAGYEREGLRELWLVDTAADELLLFRRSAADAAAFDIALQLAGNDTLTSPRLPRFALVLDELFGE